MKKVICIGSALKDIFMPTSDGVVTETPEDVLAKRKITFELGAKYRIEDRYTATGGGALNMSVALARLGVEALPYALIGGDATGDWIRSTLIKNNVRTDLLKQASEKQSDLSMVLIDRKTGERVIFVNRDLQETLHIDTNAIGNNAIIFVSALSGKWKENYTVIQQGVKKCGCELAYNPGQSNIDEDISAVREMIAQSTYLFVNKDEATQIVLESNICDEGNVSDIASIMKGLRELKSKTVVITDGMKGAWMLYDNTIYYVPSSGAHPLDATGAGDAFAGSILSALLHGEAPRTALAWAAINSGSVIKFYGSTEGLLHLKEMYERVEVTEQNVTEQKI